MQLWVFRHGPAETRDARRWPDDDRRPLTAAGVRQTRKAAEGFARLRPDIAVFAASPAIRAARTAALVHAALDGGPPVEFWDELRPGESAAAILERVRRSSNSRKNVLVVGHEPTLSELIGLGLVGDAVSVVHLAKAGAAELEFSARVVPGGAELTWLLPRRLLEELRR